MKITLLTALLSAAFLAPAAAQEADYDLQVVSVQSPKASPESSQAVTFTVKNLGAPVSAVTAGIRSNGETLSEETVQFDNELATGADTTITLATKVSPAYGSTVQYEVYAEPTNHTDADETNNTLAFSVTMPKEMSFPYTWDDATSGGDFTTGDQWRYTSNGAFQFSGSKKKLTQDIYSGVFNFDGSQKVKCAFTYNSSDVVEISLVAFDGENVDTLSTVREEGNGGSYSDDILFGQASGTVQLGLHVYFPERRGSYAVFNISNIAFSESSTDLSTTAILEPNSPKIATGSKTVVKARFQNVSASAITNPTFAYNATGEDVFEEYPGTVAPGETVDYTFNTAYTPTDAGSRSLKVWCDYSGDDNFSNDTVTTANIMYYSPKQFPFSTTFDIDNDLWTIIDANNNGYEWAFAPLTDGDSLNNVAGFAAAYGNYDDYLVSPAVTMPAGKSRVAFYYAGQGGGAHLTLLRGRTPDPTQMTEVLFDRDVNNDGWDYGAGQITTDEPDNYYFAFHLTGGTEQVLIDNFAVNDDEDLSMVSTKFDTTSGFNKTTSKVTLQFANTGVSPQSNVEVAYYINDINSEPVAREVVPETVQPGDTISYTFATPADISATDSTYHLIGAILTKVGPDQRNDRLSGETISNYANQTIPYHDDFSDQGRNGQWAMTSADSRAAWTINFNEGDYANTSSAYNDGGYLSFRNRGQKDNDAWAYSECIEIPAGTYDVNFFYRTDQSWEWSSYSQNFEVKLGTDANPEAMKTEITSLSDVIVAGETYKRFTGKVTVAEDGKYYLGFHSTGKKHNGHIFIDEVNIEPVAEGKELTYETDFSDDWYKYYPKFTPWSYDGTAMEVSHESGSLNHSEGYIVSPKLSLKAGRKVNIELTYQMTGSDDAKLNIYKGNVNNPDSLVLLASTGSTDSASVYTLEYEPVEADSVFYIAFKSNSDYSNDVMTDTYYDIKLTSLKVSYEEDPTGINGIASADGNSSYSVYDLSGRKVRSGNGSANVNGLHGVYIVSTSSAGTKSQRKVVLK